MIPDPPRWLTPAQAGLITNSASSAGTAFSPPLTVHYSSPAGADDGPVAARYKMTQTRLRGSVIDPTVVYDSGWGRPAVGATGATSDLPMLTTLTARGAMWAESVGRVYLFDYARHLVWSAPVSGTSVGSWRAENPPPDTWSLFGDPTLVCGQVFCLSTRGIVQVPLNSDGTLGTWIYSGASGGPAAAAQGAPGPGTGITAGAGLAGLDFGQGQGGILAVVNTAGVGTVFSYFIDPTTSTVASQIQGPNVPAGAGFVRGALWFDTSWWPGSTYAGTTVWLHLIPGQNANTYWITVTVPSDAAPGTFGSAWNAGATLPNALHRFGFATTPQMSTGGRLNGPDWGKDQDNYVFGGMVGTNTTPVTSILAISGVNFRAGGTGRWGSVTPPSGWTPAANCAAATWPMPGANHALPAFCMGQFGGTTDADSSVAALTPTTFFPGQMASAPGSSAPALYAPGSNQPLPPTGGTGAVMPEAVPQDDGGYLFTFTPNLPSQSTWGGPFDGDQYTMEVDFVSCQTGDPSPPALTTVDFAKPPTILNVSPSGTTRDGSPIVSFTYQAGAFGGPMQAWRAVITLGDQTLADSGLQNGDTTWVPAPAPCLAPGHTYGLQIEVWSTDQPMTDQDSVSALYNGSFTPSYASPDSPYDLVCIQDLERGAVNAHWQNPPGVAFNRIYYRLTKSEDKTWWLLQEGIHASPDGEMELTLIDQLALRQWYDFAVTGLDATQTRESGVTIAISNGDMEEAGPGELQPGKQSIWDEGFEQGTTDTVLWRSLGTDAMNTADGWTLTAGGGAASTTVEGNVMHQGQYAWAQAGHPDWQDGTFSVRFTIPKAGVQCWPKIMVHVGAGGSSWVSFEWVAVSIGNPHLRIWCQSPQFTGLVSDGAAIAQTAQQSYWMTLTAQDHNYTGHLYTDAGGTIGNLLGSISGTTWPTAVGAGQVALTCLGGQVQWGGPYPNVCTWTGPAPQGWLPTMPGGTLPTTTTNVLTEGWADLTNWTSPPRAGDGVVTVGSGQATIPPQTLLLSTDDTYGDGVLTVRFQQGAASAFSAWVVIRAANSNDARVIHGVIVGWNGNFQNPSRLYIDASTAKGWETRATGSASTSWTAGAWYWVRVIAQGPSVTASLYSDNAGAMGTLLQTCTAFVPEFQSGSVGAFNATLTGGANLILGALTYDAYPSSTFIEPGGDPAALNTVWSDGFADLSNWSQTHTTAATLSANVVTIPSTAGILSTRTFGDGIWTVRVRNNTTSSSPNPTGWPPWVFVRATNTSGGNTASWKGNGVMFQWNGGFAQSGGWPAMVLFKVVGGVQTTLSYTAGLAAATNSVAASAWVWIRAVMKGPHITVQVLDDNAGAIGALRGEVAGYVPDPALQRGSVGLVTPALGTNQTAYAMGGAYQGVCTFQEFVPALGPGEPSFCHSGWEAQAGLRSVSIYQPQGQQLSLAYPGWSYAFETIMIPLTQGDYYQFAAQVNSSSPENTTLELREYDLDGDQVRSTLIPTPGAGLNWNPSYVVTAEGSSANYTNSSRGTMLRQAPSFNATVVGSVQEGQPVIVIAAQVPDQERAGFFWWPVAWQNGQTAYCWTADAPGPATTTRGGLLPQRVGFTASLVPTPDSAYLAFRCVATGPGLHYFDEIVVVALPNTSTALFTSLGPDATGTLDAWDQISGAIAPYLLAVTGDGAANWWRLDDADDADPTTADDYFGSDAALSGTVQRGITGPILEDPRAMSFADGGKLTLPATVSVGSTAGSAWTLQLWVNLPSPAAAMPIYSNVFGGQKALLATDASGQVTWSNGTQTVTLPATVCDGTWHHLVVTQTADGTVTLYLDGGTPNGGAQASGSAGGQLFFPGGLNAPTLGGKPLNPPPAPTALTASAMQGSVLLSWTPPEIEEGGLPITGYVIEGDMSEWSNALLGTANLWTYWPFTDNSGPAQALGQNRVASGNQGTTGAGWRQPGLLPQDPANTSFTPGASNSYFGAALPALGSTWTIGVSFRFNGAWTGGTNLQRLISLPGYLALWYNNTSISWGSGSVNPSVSVNLFDGQAHRLVARATVGGTGSVWVDGTVASVSASGLGSMPAGTWYLNAGAWSSTHTTTIDEVFFVQRAISDAELDALMAAMTTTRTLSADGTATSLTVPNLVPNALANFRIAASNDMGTSGWSDWSGATPSWLSATATAPTAPQGVSITAGQMAATVRWSAPASNGGSAITGYRIQYQRQDGAGFGPFDLGVVGSYTFTVGVRTGFRAQVLARNAVGMSPWSAWTGYVTPTAPPPPAQQIQTITVGSSSAMPTGLFSASRTLLSYNFTVPRAGKIRVYGSITLRPEYWANDTYPNGTRWVKTNAAGHSSGEALVGGTAPTWSTYYTINRDDTWSVNAGTYNASWSVRLGGGNQVRVSGGSLTVVFTG